MNVIERAKEVIRMEQLALKNMEPKIDEKFVQVVELINNRKGKVVFTGVGKSGHIGEKLAATFSSLGITSIFVHSTEAVHGDLGMINRDDVVIMISNSGKTREVLAMIPSLKIIGSKLIAFTSNDESPLAKETDLILSYSYEKEADTLNLAPTTSALVTLSVGDSLAIVLSELLDFKEKDFHVYHPGGALGEKLEKVY